MRKLFGGICLGLGILVMSCSGLCSLAVLLTAPTTFMLVAIVGGVPFAIGWAFFYLGRHLLKEPETDLD